MPVKPPGRVVCFGELLLRLSPPDGQLLLQQLRLDVSVGGAEANVAASLGCLGNRVSFISVVPDNAVGHAAVSELRKHGVDVAGVHFAPGRMGLYFLTPGAVARPSEATYDRSHSAFAVAPANTFDWTRELAGTSWLHLSGVTPALGQVPAEAALRAARAARKMGVSVSFDGNYRAKLWAAWDGDAPAILAGLLETADIVFVTERDIALVLKRDFPSTEAGRREAASAAFHAFPNIKRIASTFRRKTGGRDYDFSAVLYTPEKEIRSRGILLNGVVDRIGSGDAFAAGVLHGIIHDLGDAAALDFGFAAAALKHGIPGDFNLSTRADVEHFLAGDAPDVKR